MYKWFKATDVTTIEGLRKKYRELLKKFHPDNPEGDVEIMQEINAEYDRIFAKLNRGNSTDGPSSGEEEDHAFKEVLNAIIHIDADIEIIGCWIWCFNAFPYKDQLKALGFKYAPRKKAWTWHTGETYQRRSKREIPLGQIRSKYGSKTVKNQSQKYALDE